MTIPEIGDAPPRRGNFVTRGFGRSILFLLGRWRVKGFVPNEPRFLVVVAPHTSNWDFVLGMAAILAMSLRISYIGKHTLFRMPFKPFFTWLGGYPVNRSKRNRLVDQMVALYQKHEKLILALSPEGTRSKVSRWRTGFYYCAQGAQVPILPAGLDFAKKELRLGPLLFPSGDQEADLKVLRTWFATIRGRHPENYGDGTTAAFKEEK